MNSFLDHFQYPTRIFIILAILVGAHLAVILVRALGARLMAALPQASFSKIRSLSSLVTSIVIFGLYFASIGWVLTELGVSLTAYLASASVVGLAIGFGSQGLIQDVVTGLTLIFSDLIDIDDMVEISGQTGLVKKIGMRFTVIKNHLGAEVYIPNRTITNVINYPRGYVRCFVDASLGEVPAHFDAMTQKISPIVDAAFEQFRGIFLTPPTIEGLFETKSGRNFLRIKFRIWPGRGTPLETTLKQELVQSLRQLDPSYTDWMVSVTYEVEQKSIPLTFREFPRKK